MFVHFFYRFGRYLEKHGANVERFTGDTGFHIQTLIPGKWANDRHIALAAAWLATPIHVWFGPSKTWISFPPEQQGFSSIAKDYKHSRCIYIRNEHDHYEPVYEMWVDGTNNNIGTRLITWTYLVSEYFKMGIQWLPKSSFFKLISPGIISRAWCLSLW